MMDMESELKLHMEMKLEEDATKVHKASHVVYSRS